MQGSGFRVADGYPASQADGNAGKSKSLQLLNRHGDHYENTPVATAYLSKTSPQRLTGYINYSNSVMWRLC